LVQLSWELSPVPTLNTTREPEMGTRPDLCGIL
jgi:hypothetical protein